jgi:Tfp pilus assembly protein PilV
VEVMIAVLVLALVLTTSITTMQRALLSLDSARCLETANRIIECELEKERLFTWTAASDATFSPTIDTAFARDPTIAARFTLSRALTTVANHNNQMVQVSLTVVWRTYDGRSQSRNHVTYFGKGGLNDFIYNRL